MTNAKGDGTSSSAEARTDALACLRSVFDTVREPLLVLDGRFQVRSANRSFYRTFRVSPPDTEGRLLYELGNGQWDIPRLRTLLEEILPHDTAFDDFEVEHDFPEIGRKVMLLNARRLRQEGGELILLALEDVTERRRVEVERQEIETPVTSRVKKIKGHSTFTLDPEGRVTSWNVAAEHILGYTEGEALGRHFSFTFTPEDQKFGLPEAELRAAQEQGRAEDERWHLCKDGERFWALGIVSALRDIDGRLTGFSKILRDMTDRKRAEHALQASEQRLRLALDAAYTLAFEWDIPRDEVRRQHSRMKVLPETPEDRPSSLEEVSAAVHPDDRESFLANLHTALAHPERGYRGEFRLREPDGRIVWLAEYGYLECDVQGQPQRLIGLSQDITERKAAENALRASEVRYRTLVEATGAVTWSCPPSGLQTDPQPLWMGFTGQTAEQMLGTGWSDAVHPEDVARVAQRWQDAVARGVPFLNEHRVRRYDGEWRWVSVHAVPIRDAQGAVVEWIGMNLDITARKQAEEALLEADSRKNTFLATLAHELRNPLAPIRTGLDLVEALRGDAAACEEPVRMMDRQLKHLVRLVDDLMDVSRISRGKIQLRKERLALADLIDAALEMSDSGLSRGDRQFTVSVPSEPLVVEGDRVRLVQIIANLLNNAVKFTDAGGRIDLCVTPRGERVEIRVQDDGCGVPRERLGNIFELFSQAEPGLGGGLGIGLPLVRALVEMHGGTVCADSEGPGCGATFTVSLPFCGSAPAQAAPDTATELGVLPAQCRVLVVDDNRDIAKGLHLLLTMLGAEVRVAHDGAEAVRICEDWLPTHVLMDIGMPGMDGYEAARRLRAKHPDRAFRLIAVTGWGQEEDRQRAREAGFDEHLVKPVRVAELRAILSS